MSKISVLTEKFATLSAPAQAAISGMIEMLQGTSSAPSIHRASKKGLENKPTLDEDADVVPAKKRGRPAKEVVVGKKRGRPAKVAKEEVAPKKRGRPAKETVAETKPAKTAKVTTPVAANDDVYSALKFEGKKSEREALKAAAIKKIEKVANDDSISRQELLAKATKKGVEVTFGRGKPSEVGHKRKIAIAMVNAGVKF